MRRWAWLRFPAALGQRPVGVHSNSVDFTADGATATAGDGARREVQKLEMQDKMRQWKAQGKTPEEIIKLQVGIYDSAPKCPHLNLYANACLYIYT